MLPPLPEPKRDKGAYLRFSPQEYNRLQAIASYRQTSVPLLLQYVIVNSVLPRLEREVQKERGEQPPSTSEPPPPDDESNLAWLTAFNENS